MQQSDGVRPDLPIAPAPKAPKKKGKTIKIVGIIVASVVVLSAISAALPKPEQAPAAAAVQTPAETSDGHGSPTVDAPATPTKPTEPKFTTAQENAISTAKDYLAYDAFSKSGLIDQLKFEKYSAADARFAVGHITVNWNEQAAKSAKSYLDSSSFSRQGLIDQLKFEGFTTQQATYGVNTTGL
jgi:Host cell surface-exposed lipoprotein